MKKITRLFCAFLVLTMLAGCVWPGIDNRHKPHTLETPHAQAERQ